jgi:hypothetical protein
MTIRLAKEDSFEQTTCKIGKISHLGEGASWIFKLMSHTYAPLAITLQNNKALPEVSSNKFKTLISEIQRLHFLAAELMLQNK